MTTEIVSEVAGTVWKILVPTGSPVQADDELLIVESMKMEIPVLAPVAGVLGALNVKEGDVVAEGDLLAILNRAVP